jgi:hypothetical protein
MNNTIQEDNMDNLGIQFEKTFINEVKKFQKNGTCDAIIKAALKQIGIIKPNQIKQVLATGSQNSQRKIDFTNILAQEPLSPELLADVMLVSTKGNIPLSLKYGPTIKVANFGVGNIIKAPEQYKDLLDAFGINPKQISKGVDTYVQKNQLGLDTYSKQFLNKQFYNTKFVGAINIGMKVFSIRMESMMNETSGLYMTGKFEKFVNVMQSLTQSKYETQSTDSQFISKFNLSSIEKRPLSLKGLLTDKNTQWFTSLKDMATYMGNATKMQPGANKPHSGAKYGVVGGTVSVEFDRKKLSKFLSLIWGEAGYYYFHEISKTINIFRYIDEKFIADSSKPLSVSVSYPSSSSKQTNVYVTTKYGLYLIEIRSSHGKLLEGLEAKCSYQENVKEGILTIDDMQEKMKQRGGHVVTKKYLITNKV